MQVIYIAGRMTGIENFNHSAFNMAEVLLRKKGYKVINPAILPTDLPVKSYMPMCLAMIDQCDGIALLPDWEKSEGAQIEYMYGKKRDLTVLPLSEWIIPDDEEGCTVMYSCGIGRDLY